MDYLLKPVAPDRLARAVDRVVAKLRASEPASAAATEWIEEFWAPHRSEVIRVAAIDIDRIDAERDYMRLHIGARSSCSTRRSANWNGGSIAAASSACIDRPSSAET